MMGGKVANYESASGSVRVPVSFLTLRFEDSKLENSYQESLQTKQAQFLTSCVTFHLVVFFAAMCVLWAYLNEQTEQGVVILQASVLCGVGLTCTALFLLAWLVSSQRIKHLCVCLVVVLSSAAFALSDQRFASTVLSQSNSESSVSSFLLFTVVALPFVELMQYHLLQLVSTLVVSVLLQVALLLVNNYPNTVVCEFLVTFIVLVYLGTKVHRQEKKHRRDFYFGKLDGTSVSEVEEFEQWEHRPMNTEREMLLCQLFETHEILMEVCNTSVHRFARLRLKEALKRITLAGNALRSGRSIDKPDLGKLTKSATAEYKSYLEENCWPQQVSELKRIHPPSLKVEPIFAEDLQPLLVQIDNNWNFDMLHFEEVSRGRPLQQVGEFCMKKYSLNLDEKKCSRFLQEVEQKYKNNPYHNSTHGADVTHSMLFLFVQSPLIKEAAELELLGSVIAALCHDVGHPGLNNRYLINTKSSFALICNKQHRQ